VKIINHFEVPYYQYLNEESQINEGTPSRAIEIPSLIKLYRLMVLVRAIDTKAIALQRTGKLGTYPSTRGQEAVFVGVGYAMQKEDIFVPYYRDMGTLIQRGVKPSQVLQYWGGDERGNVYDNEDFPYSVPIGSQILHAAGAAFAVKYKKEHKAVLSLFGEGATSQGDFYEAMNVSGVWKLPIVFVVCNNQWAISVSREAQTAAESIAQKAIAAGFSGEQVDGNDIVAIVERTKVALQNAREDYKPHLIEMVCYRQHDHTTADDASRYEPKSQRDLEWKKEPVMRLRRYLESQKAWSEKEEKQLEEECRVTVDETVQEYVNIKPQPLTDMFDYLYAELPEAYQEQRNMVIEMEKALHG